MKQLLLVHDYYKCNEINYEKFYKCKARKDLPHVNKGIANMSSGYIQYFTSVVLVTFIINTVFDPGARVNFWTFEVSVKIFSNMSTTLDTLQLQILREEAMLCYWWKVAACLMLELESYWFIWSWNEGQSACNQIFFMFI